MTKHNLSRRNFLAGAGTVAATATISAKYEAYAGTSEAKSGIRYLTMGRTGLKVSAMSFGTVSNTEPDVLRYGIDKGINLLHTSRSYSKGKSMESVGKAIKGKRDKLFLALKANWNPKDDDALDQCLKTLGADHVDLCMFPRQSPEQVRDDANKEAFERWKKAGKVRFMGLTSHSHVAECMEAALMTDWYDVLMPSYNLSMKKSFETIFEKCRKQNVAMMLMKTAKGLSGMTYEEAIPVYLEEPCMGTICKGMKSFSIVDSYLAASSAQVSVDLRQRAQMLAENPIPGDCQMCSRCTDACPNGLSVDDLVRSVSYYLDVSGDMDEGRDAYSDIPMHARAHMCQDCGRCEQACPNSVPVRQHIARAARIYRNIA